MFSSNEFIEIFYFISENENENKILDKELLHFILQFFFNRIQDESTFSTILNPIIIFLEKSIQNLKIRKVLQDWLIDKNIENIKFEIKIPNEYFEKVEKEKEEQEKRIDELRKKRLQKENILKKNKDEGEEVNVEEDVEDDEDDEEDEDEKKKFNPTEGLKTPLSVLISHMTHFNYQFKTSICNFLFTL